MVAASREVADHLSNTPAVAAKSYVDPCVIECLENGDTVAAALRRAGEADLSEPAVRALMERAVHRMLRTAGSQR